MEVWMILLGASAVVGVGWIIWWWNEIWYMRPVKTRCLALNLKLPPGHLGFPFFGETLSFLWLFNVVARPDHFITSKKHRYFTFSFLFLIFLIYSLLMYMFFKSGSQYILSPIKLQKYFNFIY